jgi:hypothetical protein
MQGMISCKQAKQMDLVEYLAMLGHQPKIIRNHDHWYLSPFRDEKAPSFKVNRQRNVWYDHGAGKGGNLVDFAVQYFNCSVKELLEKLSGQHSSISSFHPPLMAAEKKDQKTAGKIIILDERKLASKPLLEYLEKRKIPVAIAEQFCREIDFLLYNKKHTAIGFKNNAGGYELRSSSFKGSSSPKAVSFIDKGKPQQLNVFEGFFNFLSFQTIIQQRRLPVPNMPDRQSNFLVLNSLSFFHKAREQMEKHIQVHLFLDRDNAGRKHTEQALQWDKTKYTDESHSYQNHKDLNEWLIQEELSKKQSQRIGKRL